LANSVKVGPFRIAKNQQRGKWLLDVPASFSPSGIRQRLTFNTKAEAIDEARRQLDVLSKRLAAVSNNSRRRNLKTGKTLAQLANDWITDQQSRVALGKKRSSTLEKNLYQLRNVVEFAGSIDIGLLDGAKIEEYQHHRIQLGRSKATINDEVATLLIAIRWAVRRGWLDQAPEPEQLRVRARLEWLPSIEEMTEIYRHLPPSLQPLFRLLCETGCRKSEAFKLKWAQVDELRGRISFEDTKTDASVRYVPISEELRAELRALPKNSEYVFAGRKHDKPIDNMRKALASAVRKAGILDNGKPAKLTPQVIRRAVLSWHAEAGTAESIAQALCGHARGSRVTQKAYTHHSVEAVARSIIKLPTEEHSENKLAKNLATNGNKQPKRR
jgi:integrase